MTGIFKAKTIEEAKKKASDKFGVGIDKISFKVIKEAKKGFLGIGSADAEIEATYTPAEALKPADSDNIISEESFEVPEKPVISENNQDNQEKEIISEEEKSQEFSEEKTEVISENADNFDDSDEYSLDNFTLIEDESLLNQKTKIARDYIISVLAAMGVEAKAKIYQNEKGAVIDLESNSNGTIIGRRGETLDALQYLSSMISNKGDKEYFRITIDCFGYREKRKATLEQLAVKVAKSVLKTGRSQPLEPMNPYERRVIHSAISEIEGVSSRSVGDEPYRKIIISSTNPRKKSSDKSNNRGRGGKNFNNKKRVRHESKDIDLSTSFEKDYKKPKPEDSIEGGLYGKIEF